MISKATLIWTYGVTGVLILLALVTSVVTARLLGPEARGMLMALMFWPQFLGGVLCLGLNEATAYRTAQARAGAGDGAVAAYASSGLVLQLLVVSLITPVIVLLLPLVLSGRPDSVHLAQTYAAFFVPAMLLDLHFKAVLQGRGDFRSLNILRLTQPFLYALILVILVFKGEISVPAVLAGTVVAFAASLAFGAARGWTPPLAATQQATRDTLKTGWRFHAANLLLYCAAEVDKLMVLHLMDDHDIGLYSVALAVGQLGSNVVVQSFGVTITSEMSHAATREQRVHVLTRSLNDSALLLAAVNGAAALTAHWWLPFVFGEDFRPAQAVAILLLAAGVFKGLRQVLDRTLRAMHITRSSMIGETVTLLAAVVFGAAGAAIAKLPGFACGLVLAQAIGFGVLIAGAARQLDTRILDVLPLRDMTQSRLMALFMRAP